MTREELLEKGVSEEVADEIVAAFEDSSSSNSLELLEKALSAPKEESLFKADDENPEEEEKEYDEEYMKKYMKKYMKENKSACMKAAKEAGIFADEMKKAIDDIDLNAEGAVIEMADLTPVLTSQIDFNEKMVKAMEDLAEKVTFIAEHSVQNYDLMQKAARVQVEQAKALDGVLSQPNGRKGVIAHADLAKASTVTGGLTPEMNNAFYSTLFKATKGGDHKAGEIISLFESANRDIRALTPEHRQYVNDLLAKEAN
jgi:hypothetical protein